MRCTNRILPSLTIALALIIAGCGDPSGSTSSGNKPSADDHAHGDEHDHDHADEHHHDDAPHGGTIVDWGGGKFHLEFVVDHDRHEATVWVLGDDAKTPAPIAATELRLNVTEPEMEIVLAAEPLDGEPAGSSSRFVGTHDGLATVREFAGTIAGVVDQVPYAADFSESAHGDHQH